MREVISYTGPLKEIRVSFEPGSSQYKNSVKYIFFPAVQVSPAPGKRTTQSSS